MNQRRALDHVVLLFGVVVFIGPLVLLFWSAATAGGLSGGFGNFNLVEGLRANLASLDRLSREATSLNNMLLTSTQLALGVAFITTATGFLAAYAMTHFAKRGMRIVFAITLLTLYFPVEARLLQTFDVANALGLINTMTGLILPILPIAVATFFLRQHLLTLPPEISEAARLDGAGPLRFLWDFLLPLSVVPLLAVFIISFILGWNQYLWPLMISVDNSLFPLMRGLNLVGAGSGPSMVIAAASMGPPLLLMLAFLALLRKPRV